jgi:hypothetical protein
MFSRRMSRERRREEIRERFEAAPKTPAEPRPVGFERLVAFFGAPIRSRAFHVWPRVLMHQMPDDWQRRAAELLEEFEAAFPNGDDVFQIRCRSKTTGKLVETPEFYLSYLKRDGLAEVAKMRAEASP